ncbi:PREDICTED: aminopeptidase N-like [Polistes dominula]|uniref:Aminopeptidase n=1 Tax=Polistes dominula TaxID=743375 RepID=A0ABM1IWK7_POLDO|nr:PREDICTED: aminopeptidase N-like [Polistes dominula]
MENIDDASIYRLPNNVIPISYDLKILTKLAANEFVYEAEVRITLDVLVKTNTIILHTNKLRIDKDKTFLYKEIDKISINDQYTDTNKQLYIIKCVKYLEIGRYTLILSFTGEIADDVFGFYRSSYEVNGQKKWIGVTQFSPTYARQAFPCMDEPYFKATFTITIGHYSNQTVTSNTNVKSIEQIDQFYRLTTFMTTPRMSTYLVGWSVHDYVVEFAKFSKDFKIWTRDSMQSHGSLALNQGWLIYSALQDWMKVENPIKKMDQFAIADFNFNAMENWGMITYRESVVLFENETIPMRNIVNGLTTMAHEYAHTWFGNLVTPEFWDVAWLKEGFASYFQYFGPSLVLPTWKMMDMFVVDYVQPTLLLDSMNHDRSMNGRNVGSPNSIMAMLDFVTYRKGASVIRMLNHAIGEDVFQNGLHYYLMEMSYRAARPNNLYNYLQRSIDTLSNNTNDCPSIKDVFESWANQVGYPLITVKRNYTRHWTLVSQEKFNLHRDNENKIKDNDEKLGAWWIPLTFATSSSIIDFQSTRPKLWLNPQNKRTMIPNFRDDDWVLFNVQQIGFYRVNYDESNWKMLIDHLRSKEFISVPSVNRAALLDDAFNLARSGYINYSIPFNLSKYLKRETDYEPWIAAINNFMFLNRILNKISTVHKAFQKYAENLILPIYKLLGFTENLYHDNVQTKLLREIILSTACALNNVHCLETSKMLFSSWISESNKTISANLKSFVYCIGIRNGNDDDWFKVWNKFLETDLHIEQELLLSALGCSRNPILLNKYLNVSITQSSKIRKQYRFSIVNAVTKGNPENVDHTLKFVENNLESIIDSRGYDFLGKILNTIGENMTTKEQMNKLSHFVENNTNRLGSALKAAKKAIVSVGENAKWVDKYAPIIATNL